MENLESLMIKHIQFTFSTFPEATAISSIHKLRSEAAEVLQEMLSGDKERLALEYADCLMCLTDSAARNGLSPADLLTAFGKKLEINKNRSWIKNPDNTYSHIK